MMRKTSPRKMRARSRSVALEHLEGRQLLATVLGLTTGNQLIRFDSDSPATATAPMPVLGLQAGETLVGIDYRPATTTLYGLGSTSRLYAIDPSTGVATAVGSGPFTPALSGAAFGFDFNPTVDRIRVVSDTTQNLRLNPNDGTAVVDTSLAYAAGDPGFGVSPRVTAAAYTNSFPGSTSTTLYVVDTGRDVLAIQNPANAGTLTTVGALGFDASGAIGFEIDGTPGAGQNAAFLAAAIPGGTAFYRVDLATGVATPAGAVGGGGQSLIAIAAVPPTTNFYAVDGSGALATFNSSAPETVVATRAITGLQPGEALLGVDVRPADGRLYGLGSTSRLYAIDPQTGVATAVGSGPFTPALSGAAFGFDFNPTVDRIRVVSNTGQNLRLNPNDGTAVVDGTLAYAAGDPGFGVSPQVTGAAYTNSVAGATSTTLYVIDVGRDVLAIQNPANAGTLTTVGGLGFDVVSASGFDITPAGNVAFATVTRAGSLTPMLVTINLATGAATLAGPIGAGGTVGLASGIVDAGPAISSIVRYGFHRGLTTIDVTFDRPLNAASARNLANYQVFALARNNRRTPVRLRAAAYDPSTSTVTLVPVAPRLRLYQTYGLTIQGGLAGVTDLAFTPISAANSSATFGPRNLGGQTRPVPITPLARSR